MEKSTLDYELQNYNKKEFENIIEDHFGDMDDGSRGKRQNKIDDAK